jgi:type VI secretion system Hcp family effector
MAVNAFLTFFDRAEGESNQKGREKWIEIQGWTFSVAADSSWSRGGGASVGKPSPRAIVVQQYFDTSSPTVLGYICTGKSFPKAEIKMVKAGGRGTADEYFRMVLEGVFVTQVSLSGTEDGRIAQTAELVFKTIQMEYKAQNRDGSLDPAKIFSWDIPAGTASPSV